MPTKRRSRKKQPKLRLSWRAPRWPWRHIGLGAGFVLAVLCLVALFLPGQGSLVHGLATLLRRLLGWGAYALPPALAAATYFYGVRRRSPDATRLTGGLLIAVSVLAATHLAQHLPNPFELAVAGYGGGWLGWVPATALRAAVGQVGAYVCLLALALIGALLAFELSPARALALADAATARLHPRAPAAPEPLPRRTRRRARPLPSFGDEPDEDPVPVLAKPRPAVRIAKPEEVTRKPAKPVARPRPESAPAKPGAVAEQESFVARPDQPLSGWQLPDASTIFSQVEDEEDAGEDMVEERAEIIEETFAALGVPAEVVDAQRGPAVTQFAVRPGTIERRGSDGIVRHMRVRVSKIQSLQDDLALALSASPVRIQAPIPGRSLVGVEVPNPKSHIVPLGSVLLGEDFAQRFKDAPLALALGRDISGRSVGADLSKMPHLLMAGATGSGKSVALNAIIASLLSRNTPLALRLVLVDPKRVELMGYAGLPHVIGKVVADAEEAVGALKWASREMDRRYAAFADVGARDLKGYNSRTEKEGNTPLPRIVIIIDELADLMMNAPYDVERTLVRLAQMARATGIHLIVATQRPSVDVITGLLKANFPARIAFAVSTMVDSRVILDVPGAERLLGRGDMLFMSPSGTRLTRAQGCWVSDEEIAALVQYWRRAATAVPEDGPMVQGVLWDEAGASEPKSSEDPLLAQAIDIVKQEGRASTTMLQRHLRVGYNRASRLVDTLVERGIVSGEVDARHGSRSVIVPEAESSSDGDAGEDGMEGDVDEENGADEDE